MFRATTLSIFPIAPSQNASNLFSRTQGQVTSIERLLSQAHWNHSINIVNSSTTFQNSIPLDFHGTPRLKTLNSISPTPDQLFHHCIGKQPGTTRAYPTLPLIIDPKFVVFFPASSSTENSKFIQIDTTTKQRADNLLKQSKILFSVEFVVDQDELIYYPQAASPPIVWGKNKPIAVYL